MDKDSSKEIPSDSQHPIIPPRMDTPVRVVVFRDTTIELSSPDDCFLTEVSHLILEADADGTSLGGTDLFSRGSAPWIWDTKSTPCFVEMFLDFTMSVWMKVSENERQLLASVTFNGQELYDAKEVELEVAMTRHEDYPDLILKAKAISAEDIKALPPPRGPTSFDGAKLNTLLQFTNIAYEKFQKDGDMASLEKIILHLQTVTSLVNKNESTLPSLLSNLGTAFANRFRKLGHVSDINNAIMRFQTAVDLIPPTNAKRAYYLDQIGRALVDRFQKLEDIADIDQAILRQQEAVDLIPDGHPNKPDYLNNLGKSFQRRSAYRNSITDINDTISTQKAAITLTPDKDPRKATYLSDLGANLQLALKGSEISPILMTLLRGNKLQSILPQRMI
ncbi:hypothetical protein CPB86DRAFT_549998 [Serendipita vermifera]|nr:hypothetical protein CPB86DRAFT_549998 [Serendipita vermifera]